MPLHPFLVHFPIAAWLLGTLVLWTAFFGRRPRWREHAWLLLALGALASIPAAISGQAQMALHGQLELVELKRHGALGNLLPWLLMSIIVMKAHTVFRKPPIRLPDWPWCLVVSVLAVVIVYAASLGGKLVYQLGIGVDQF